MLRVSHQFLDLLSLEIQGWRYELELMKDSETDQRGIISVQAYDYQSYLGA